MKRILLAAAIGILVAAGAGPQAVAHHSFAAAYDMNAPVSVTGRIVEVRLTNPHSHFFLDVENENGEIERWSFEAGTPSGMIRNGYSPTAIPNGSEVTINGFRAKDRTKPAGMLRELVTADGKTFGMFGPVEGPGAR